MNIKQNDIRLIKHHNRDGTTWSGQQSFPDGTWKNRQIWKPVTPPLEKAEMLSWLSQQNTTVDAADYFN